MPKREKYQGNTHKCGVCGKTFYISYWCREWIYKHDKKMFCSYTCYRAFVKNKADKKALKAQQKANRKSNNMIEKNAPLPEDFYKIPDVGARLKFLRKQRKLSQEKLAELLDVAPQQISYYERKYQSKNTETLQKLLKFYDITVKELYKGVEV